jgi:predicted aspartyl protease
MRQPHCRQTQRRTAKSYRVLVCFLVVLTGSLLVEANASRSTAYDISFIPDSFPDLGTEPFYQRAGADRTQVRFDLIDNRPVFRVRLNASDKLFDFVLDTGSHMTVISTKTAARLSLMAKASSGRATGVGGQFQIVYALLRSCQVGAVRLENVPVFVLPLSNEKHAVDGYIGTSFISQFVTSVDYGERTLTLERPSNASSPSFAASAIPIKATSTGIVISDVRIAGVDRPLSFIMDTGASVSVVASGASANDLINSCEEGDRLQVSGAGGMEENVKTILLARVNIGSHGRENILAAVLDLKRISEAAGSQQTGIVGGNFLRHFLVIFDLPRGVVRLKPLAQESDVVSTAAAAR